MADMSWTKPDGGLAQSADLQTDRPHPARVYDYLLGGKDNFEADRRAAVEGLEANPNSRIPPR
jgi:S-adenosyl methyltransferase